MQTKSQILDDGLILPSFEIYGGICYLSENPDDLECEKATYAATQRRHPELFSRGLHGTTFEGYVTYDGRSEKAMSLIGEEADTTWL